MNRNIVLYSAQRCSDCQKLKEFMDARGIDYELRDIRENPDFAAEVQQATGKLGVPYLVIDGLWVRGYQIGEPFSDEFATTLFQPKNAG